jgi:hypothetical protein
VREPRLDRSAKTLMVTSNPRSPLVATRRRGTVADLAIAARSVFGLTPVNRGSEDERVGR